MKVFTKSLLIASLGLAAAGTALADSSQVNVNGVTQSQQGNRNTQAMEVGVVDMDTPFGTSNAVVNATNLRQTQSGNDNNQSMTIGKIDKNLGSHSVRVTANNISQTQSGTRNTQRLKIGTVE
jgi:hypothetical protein